jgi:NAD-dependent dihydropyrimidine dehydrogenase PreA subunit
MKRLGSLWGEVVQTLLRVLPFPCRTGLVRIGNPGRSAPVLLTCNFKLTVERVKRALDGIDAYLLVANSHGVNVWCAATGGLLTNHDVVSVLKTSGIESLVDHRDVILPQLAATGIEGRVVRERTGWKVVWGPVRADAIAAFLKSGLTTTKAMRTVTFPWTERLEMAVAWAFPISLLALLLLPVWPAGALPVAGLVWAVSLVMFMGFPLYERSLHVKGRKVGFVLFDFGERGVSLIVWALFLLALFAYGALAGELSWGFALRWSVASLVVLLILGLDLTGSTPVYKSGLHEDRLLEIALDEGRCRGAAFCERVCPKDVFEIDRRRRLATLSRAEQCVQCGACIVQCPFDALYFRSPNGGIVEPDTVRHFKLNLIGSREKLHVRRLPAVGRRARQLDGHE